MTRLTGEGPEVFARLRFQPAPIRSAVTTLHVQSFYMHKQVCVCVCTCVYTYISTHITNCQKHISKMKATGVASAKPSGITTLRLVKT